MSPCFFSSNVNGVCTLLWKQWQCPVCRQCTNQWHAASVRFGGCSVWELVVCRVERWTQLGSLCIVGACVHLDDASDTHEISVVVMPVCHCLYIVHEMLSCKIGGCCICSFALSQYKPEHNKQSYRHAYSRQVHLIPTWPFDLRVSACLGPAVDYISNDFGVDSSSFSFRSADKHTDTLINTTHRPTHTTTVRHIVRAESMLTRLLCRHLVNCFVLFIAVMCQTLCLVHIERHEQLLYFCEFMMKLVMLHEVVF